MNDLTKESDIAEKSDPTRASHGFRQVFCSWPSKSWNGGPIHGAKVVPVHVAVELLSKIAGFLPAPLIFLFVLLNRRRVRKKDGNYNLDPHGTPGAFEPLLQKYLHLAEFIIGLATGSIVLLFGSSVLHGKDGRLPGFYTTPLLILGTSVIMSIVFMVALLVEYEDVQHGSPHTPGAYALIEALGLSSLVLFVLGYIWLIFAVTS